MTEPEAKSNQTIYIITKGSYSDYTICAATTSKERAEKLRKYYSDSYDDAKIEEYNENEPDEDLDDLVPVYYVKIDRDGTCYCHFRTWAHEKTGEIIEDSWHSTDELGGEIITEIGKYSDVYLQFNGYYRAPDKEHALKIAQDERAKLLERYMMDCGEEYETKMDFFKRSGPNLYTPVDDLEALSISRSRFIQDEIDKINERFKKEGDQ